MHKIFIDGSVGTTGLRIVQRLSQREDLNLVLLNENERKNIDARVKAAKNADISVLCLPDEAAKELVSRLPSTARVCDTSTAHRTNDDWIYGFAEINNRREQIKNANRVSIPGCHASGFIALITPLIEQNLLDKSANLNVYSITGYTGGGKGMIADYENSDRQNEYNAPRAYALSLKHKHLPEMKKITGIKNSPLFCPVVADFPRGMAVSVPLFQKQFNSCSAKKVVQALKTYYNGEKGIIVHDLNDAPANGFLPANIGANSDLMHIYCYENEEEGQILLTSVFDNLGKGSSGAAIQCINIMLGLPERAGLE